MDDPNQPVGQVSPPATPPANPLHRRFLYIGLGALFLLLVTVFLAQLTGSHTEPSAGFGPQPVLPPVTPGTDAQKAAAEQAQNQARAMALQQQLENDQKAMSGGSVPPAEAPGVPPMTPAQTRAIYGDGSNSTAATAPRPEKHSALTATTVAIDFSDRDRSTSDGEKKEQAAGTASTVSPQKVEEVGGSTAPIDSPHEETYRILGGTVIETVLTNRINGEAVGPIDCMLLVNVYSHDHQTLLIPQGTRILGSVASTGQQQRLFVAFHRAIMPNGDDLSLNQFKGLDVTGQVGLRDLVNHHYVSIFGTSLALAAIGAIAQVGSGYTGYGYDPITQMRTRMSDSLGQSATQVLDRFINQLPTFVFRERTRVKIKLTGDLDGVRAYREHRLGHI